MTLVDVNILIYAEDTASLHHAVVRPWWDALMNGGEPVAFCWHVLNGFLRIATHPKIAASPLTPAVACAKISTWLAHANTVIVNPGLGHWLEYERIITATNATGNLLMDATSLRSRLSMISNWPPATPTSPDSTACAGLTH